VRLDEPSDTHVAVWEMAARWEGHRSRDPTPPRAL